jgi:hypothetical protein
MQRSVEAVLAMVVCCSPASAGPAVAHGSFDPAQRNFGCSGSIFRALSKSSLTAACGASKVSVEKVTGAEGEGVTVGLGWDYGGLVKDWRGGGARAGETDPRRPGKSAARLSAGRRTGAGALRAGGRDGCGERRAGLQIRRHQSRRGPYYRHEDHLLLRQLSREAPFSRSREKMSAKPTDEGRSSAARRLPDVPLRAHA